MKNLTLALLIILISQPVLHAQENEKHLTTEDTVKRPSTFYVAVTNKFTAIKGEYANIGEVYGGWVFNRKLMLGIGASVLTNNILVPDRYSAEPGERLSYMYGQAGLVAEYIPATYKKFHFVYHLFSGVGLTLQYDRSDEMDDFFEDFLETDDAKDQDLFFVAEPGVQLEINLLKWMRLSPGVTYRAAFGSGGSGLGSGELSNFSFNLTLKVGKF